MYFGLREGGGDGEEKLGVREDEEKDMVRGGGGEGALSRRY
jgi:hypothetical protein